MELVLIELKDMELLKRMLQLYLHELSFYFPMEFNDKTGSYSYNSLNKYFDDSKNYAYFIKEKGKTLGFIFVDTNENENIIQELFVLNPYKLRGIGKKAVYQTLSQMKGNWTIKSLPCSKPVEEFWTKILKEYTNNNFKINCIGKYNRAVFMFNNTKK